jgi:two-component system, NtrC family, response regulator AtoC
MAATNTSSAHRLEADHGLPPDPVIFGTTPRMLALRQQLEKACRADIPILIQGEGGSGKEVLARWIHRNSPYSRGPFVKVNFAAIPGSLLESELFGYQPGAFTGAVSTKIGRIEMADGGTLFLDQITDLDSSFQAKLLQVLQDGRFTRLGDHEERVVKARLIYASAKRLEDAVARGQFREDLYYRIKVFEVDLPPLSERRRDIPEIANYLLLQLNARFQQKAAMLEESKLRMLQNLEWPGNIREMENWISRYILLGNEQLPEEKVDRNSKHISIAKEGAAATMDLKHIVRQAQREMSRKLILDALRANRWNRRKAAKELKISYRTLLYEIRDVGLPSKRMQKQAPEAAAKDGSA